MKTSAPFWIIMFMFAVGILVGGFAYPRIWPCPDTSELYRALDERKAQVDTLKSANVHLLNMIDDDRVELRTDTVTVRVREKLKWYKASDLDTTARLLFSDPL